MTYISNKPLDSEHFHDIIDCLVAALEARMYLRFREKVSGGLVLSWSEMQAQKAFKIVLYGDAGR